MATVAVVYDERKLIIYSASLVVLVSVREGSEIDIMKKDVILTFF